jgi:hypothetical protein
MNDAFLAGYFIIVIVIRILFIWGCISLARKKGRGTTTAGILGFFFGLWALIGYLLVSEKKSSKAEALTPTCPICESDTTLRIVKAGKDKGKQFYVCTQYPECKGRIKA